MITFGFFVIDIVELIYLFYIGIYIICFIFIQITYMILTNYNLHFFKLFYLYISPRNRLEGKFALVQIKKIHNKCVSQNICLSFAYFSIIIFQRARSSCWLWLALLRSARISLQVFRSQFFFKFSYRLSCVTVKRYGVCFVCVCACVCFNSSLIHHHIPRTKYEQCQPNVGHSSRCPPTILTGRFHRRR